MLFKINNLLKIIKIEINNISYHELLDSINSSINTNEKNLMTYANAHTINCSLADEHLLNSLKEFDIIHPDGLGIYLASKFLYGVNGFKKKITGSDFYIKLIQEGIKNSWSFYFFGDSDETLIRISKVNPDLVVKGFCNGYNFINESILKNINQDSPDILIVGLGTPKQEEWIAKNKPHLLVNVIIAVGDGIKVFAGNKKRGPQLIQKIGLEWFIRFLYEPKRLWKRYFLGIPLFIFRVIKFKFSDNING